MIRIANAQIWVRDQEEALAFYTEKIGMEVTSDVTMPELGNFRWLCVAPPGQDVSIVLMAPYSACRAEYTPAGGWMMRW